jgi:hypothetical protein
MPSYPKHSQVGWTSGMVGAESDAAGPDGFEPDGVEPDRVEPDRVEPESVRQPGIGTPGHAEENHGRDTGLVRVVLNEMSPADQELLRLAYGRAFGPAEIAVTMGGSIRRAHADVQAATSRFEARSIAVALTNDGGSDCGVLAALMTDVAGLADRHCKLVAEHSASCAACTSVLANRNTGSALLGPLATVTVARATPVALIKPDAEPPRKFWQTTPVLAALSAVAVIVIAVAALGVSKLVGGHQPVSAGPVASRSTSSSAPAPSLTASPKATTTKRPAASHSAAQPPPVVQPVTGTTSPAPKSTTSHSPSPKPSSPKPSTTPATSPPPSSPPPTPPPSPSTSTIIPPP